MFCVVRPDYRRSPDDVSLLVKALPNVPALSINARTDTLGDRVSPQRDALQLASLLANATVQWSLVEPRIRRAMSQDLHAPLSLQADSTDTPPLDWLPAGVVVLGAVEFHVYAMPSSRSSQAASAHSDTLRRIACGALCMDGAHYIVARPAGRDVAQTVLPTTKSELTPREREIVSLIADGHGNKSIGAALGIAAPTVATHLRRIFAKLGVTTRAAMVCRCIHLIGPTRADTKL
jgi:DNA-binding CsgD family transcriptional regulator